MLQNLMWRRFVEASGGQYLLNSAASTAEIVAFKFLNEARPANQSENFITAQILMKCSRS